ncbi:hypothetical protein DFP73DRAFT_613013 [Morchella snyderi]|nr:hypothetical protein DFP73DRAFT_613013 [Morchella snyderi]
MLVPVEFWFYLSSTWPPVPIVKAILSPIQLGFAQGEQRDIGLEVLENCGGTSIRRPTEVIEGRVSEPIGNQFDGLLDKKLYKELATRFGNSIITVKSTGGVNRPTGFSGCLSVTRWPGPHYRPCLPLLKTPLCVIIRLEATGAHSPTQYIRLKNIHDVGSDYSTSFKHASQRYRTYVGNTGPRTTAAEVDPIDVNLEHLQITEQLDNLDQKFLPRVLDIYIVSLHSPQARSWWSSKMGGYMCGGRPGLKSGKDGWGASLSPQWGVTWHLVTYTTRLPGPKSPFPDANTATTACQLRKFAGTAIHTAS